MRILCLTTAYPTPAAPAAGIFVREHARAAALHGEVAVVHLDRSREHHGRPRLRRIEGEEFPAWRVSYQWSPVPLSAALHLGAAAWAWAAVRRAGFRPDLLHAHFFLAGIPAVIIGRAHRLPVVVTEHWSVFLPEDPMRLSPALRAGASCAYRCADIVLPVSEALKRGIARHGLRARRMEVVPNVVDTDLFSSGPNERNGRLLTVGLLYEAKGVDLLLEAVSTLVGSRPGIALDVVGDGPRRREYEALARDRGIADRVVFHGILPKAGVARMMREAELFVLASRYDNNPCAVIESLASGLPVVATAVGGIPELIDGSNGRLALPNDPASVAAEIANALDTIAGFDREAIAREAASRYSAETVGAKLAAVYASVAA
jgi:glycosyltransferase involved in cell wall biosynthesis